MRKPKPPTSGEPTAAMSGLMILSEIAVTIAVKAPPMMTAVASSITLPRRMKSLKPLSMEVSPFTSTHPRMCRVVRMTRHVHDENAIGSAIPARMVSLYDDHTVTADAG